MCVPCCGLLWRHHIDIFKFLFLNENPFGLIPKGSINNRPALVQIMAWSRTLLFLSLIFHMPMAINSLRSSALYLRHWTRPLLVQIIVCRIFGAKPKYNQSGLLLIGLLGNISMELKSKQLSFIKISQKLSSTKYQPVCLNVLTWCQISYRKITRSLEVGCSNDRVALTFDRQLGNSTVEALIKFQNDRSTLTTYLIGSRLWCY